MEISEVRIKLMDEAGDRLAAFCSVTFDNSFVVRDLKIIEGANGPFVAMPSRKLTVRCPQCNCKNHLRASYCNQCGLRLNEDRVARDDNGRAKLYADIAHPINARCREMIQDRIVQAYYEELERAKQPGYSSTYDEYDFENEFAEAAQHGAATQTRSRAAGEHTSVQPAEPHPRGPHRAANFRPAPTPPKPTEPHRRSHAPHERPDAQGPHLSKPPAAEPARGADSSAAADDSTPTPPVAPQNDAGDGAFGAGIL